MKKLLAATTLGAILAVGLAAPGHVGATSVKQAANPTATTVPTPAATPTPAPPFNGSQRSVFMTVDTVIGGGSNPAPAQGCMQTNLIRRGQLIVFRMWGVNTKLGGATLTPKNVSSVAIDIPGLSAPVSMNWGNHGAVAFWSGTWKTDANTPLGVVDYTVTVKTKMVKYHGKKVKGLTSRYTQVGLAANSRLTIVP